MSYKKQNYIIHILISLIFISAFSPAMNNKNQQIDTLELKLGKNLLQETINKLLPTIYSLVQEEVTKLKEISLKKKFLFLNFELDLNNLAIPDLIYNTNDITITQSQKFLTINLNNLNVKLNGSYNEKIPLIKKSGNFSIQLSMNAKISLNFDKTCVDCNKDGELKDMLQLKVSDAIISHTLENVTIENNKILAAVIKNSNIFKKMIDKYLNKNFLNFVNKFIEEKFNSLNVNCLLNLSIIKGIDSTIGVYVVKTVPSKIISEDALKLRDSEVFDFEIGVIFKNKVQNEQLSDSLIETDDVNFAKNMFQKIISKIQNTILDLPKFEEIFSNPSLATQTNLKTSTPIIPNNSITLNISQGLSNLLSSIIFSNINLKLNITNKMIPPSIPYKLNTYYLQDVLPDLYAKYPDKDYEISISIVNTPPNLEISSNGISISGFVLVELNLANKNLELNKSLKFFENFIDNNSETTMFSFKSAFNINISPLPNKENYKFYIKLNSLSIQNSEVIVKCGEISGKEIDNTLNPVFKTLLFIINVNFLQKGILIPKINGLDINKNDIEIFGDIFSITIEPAN